MSFEVLMNHCKTINKASRSGIINLSDTLISLAADLCVPSSSAFRAGL